MEITMTNYKTGQLVVASWYDEGMRHAGARVEANTLHIRRVKVKKGKKEVEVDDPDKNYDGALQLRVFPWLGFPMDLMLRLEDHKLLGPREMEYTLTDPTVNDLKAMEFEMQRAEAKAKEREEKAAREPRVLPEKLHKAREQKRQDRSAKDSHYVITVLKKASPFKGSRAERFAAMKTGMTIATYLEALVAAGLPAKRGLVDIAVAQGLIKLTPAGETVDDIVVEKRTAVAGTAGLAELVETKSERKPRKKVSTKAKPVTKKKATKK
jgi:hypothetical protein